MWGGHDYEKKTGITCAYGELMSLECTLCLYMGLGPPGDPP